MKRLVSMVLIFTLLFTVFSGITHAVEVSSIYTKTEIEELVRTKLNIDKEINLDYANLFTRDLQEKKFWSLQFQGENERIHVAISADTGEITNYHNWDATNYEGAITIMAEDAKKTAVKFIQTLEPQKYKETEEVTAKAPSFIIYDMARSAYEGDNYHFLFVRKLGEEFFPNNYFRVQVSGVNGKVTGYEMRWDEATYANKKSLITETKARQVFESEERLALKYVALYKNNKGEVTKPTLTPVYVYNPKESDKIHAVEGRLLKQEELYTGGQFYGPRSYGADQMATKETMNYDGGEVIPEEGILSKEKVEKAVLETLARELDITGLQVQNSHYSNYYHRMKGKFWNIYWYDEESGKSLNTTVDGEKGNIITASYSKEPREVKPYERDGLELNSLKKDMMDGKVPMEVYEEEVGNVKNTDKSQLPLLDEEKVRKEVEERIKTMFPHVKGGEVKFKRQPQMTTEAIVYFTSPRYIEGIPYEENYINVTYQYNTGEILELNYRWNDVEIQTPTKIVEKNMIEKKFYDTVGFEKYLIQLRNQEAFNSRRLDIPMKELIPVYSIKDFYFHYIDAGNGKFLDYNGEEYVEENLSIHEFKDIQSSPYKKEILLMDKMGILKEDTLYFQPDGTLLRKDALKWIVEMGWRGRFYYLNKGYGYKNDEKQPYFKDLDKDDPYYIYVEAAIENKILEKGDGYFQPEETITKIESTQWLLNAMGQKELAQFTEIFQVPYTDKGDIPKEDRGYVALAKYYNIFADKNSEGAFQPDKVFTRGEFVSILYHLLKN
ncbi:S-layer homology domain-containing protein [Natronincola ferrireducens]|uniref:S-layer homology domain-containing protein n=1 Tax=Natronincola ferrireducens TaxID=393762 RepID=A0A1G8ZYB6_9FIRM|nr:S-layer homology domain-containing protein [Natronincola ferrireducens]SDK19120.1 S-layer homology domain-containing protein [Natronincola ferrireducens]